MWSSLNPSPTCDNNAVYEVCEKLDPFCDAPRHDGGSGGSEDKLEKPGWVLVQGHTVAAKKMFMKSSSRDNPIICHIFRTSLKKLYESDLLKHKLSRPHGCTTREPAPSAVWAHLPLYKSRNVLHLL